MLSQLSLPEIFNLLQTPTTMSLQHCLICTFYWQRGWYKQLQKPFLIWQWVNQSNQPKLFFYCSFVFGSLVYLGRQLFKATLSNHTPILGDYRRLVGSKIFCAPQGGPGHHPDESEWCQMGWNPVDLGVPEEELRFSGEGGTQMGGPAGRRTGKWYFAGKPPGLVSELSEVHWLSSLALRSLDLLSLDFRSLPFFSTFPSTDLPFLLPSSPLPSPSTASTCPSSTVSFFLLQDQQSRRRRRKTTEQRPTITNTRANTKPLTSSPTRPSRRCPPPGLAVISNESPRSRRVLPRWRWKSPSCENKPSTFSRGGLSWIDSMLCRWPCSGSWGSRFGFMLRAPCKSVRWWIKPITVLTSGFHFSNFSSINGCSLQLGEQRFEISMLPPSVLLWPFLKSNFAKAGLFSKAIAGVRVMPFSKLLRASLCFHCEMKMVICGVIQG